MVWTDQDIWINLAADVQNILPEFYEDGWGGEKKENLFPLKAYEVKRELFLKIFWKRDQGQKPASKKTECFLKMEKIIRREISRDWINHGR